MNFLKKFTIKSRILSLFLLSAIGFIFISYFAVSSFSQYNFESRKETIKAQVDTAESILKRYHSASVFMGEDEAKHQAMEAIRQMRYGNGEYFWVNDIKGNMVMHPMKPELNKKNVLYITDPNGVAIFEEFVKVGNTEEAEGFVEYQWDKKVGDTIIPNVDKLSFVRHFKPWGLIVGTGLYMDDLQAQTRETAKDFAIIAGSIGVLLIFIYGMVILSISKPMESLRLAMRNISSGESDLTAKLPVEGKDELADISMSFNNFVSQLRAAILDVKDASHDSDLKRKDVQEMITSSDEHIVSINTDLDSIMAAVTENSATVSEIAENTNRSAENAVRADQATKEGYTCVKDTGNAIEEMSQRFKSTEVIIQNLVKNSSEVDNILETITNISDQTNLLALNAAIEAARAGEYGRGFAVVADEVRTLAVKSKDSAESIRDILIQLQGNVSDVVNATEASEMQCETAKELSYQAGEHLNAITNIIGEITDMSTQIASATSQQESVSTELDQRIIDIAESVKQLKENNLDTISKTEEQANSSQSLSGAVEQFKV